MGPLCQADSQAAVERLRRFYRAEMEKVEEDESGKEESVVTRNVQELMRRYKKEFFEVSKKGSDKCRHCGQRTKGVKKYKSRIIFEGSGRVGENTTEGAAIPVVPKKRGRPTNVEKMELNPGELIKHFRELWGHEPEVRTKQWTIR